MNPANGRVNVAGGKAFADFMVAPSTQKMIQGLVSISSASIRASDVGIAAIIPENPGSLKFAGKIREVFCAQEDSQMVVDCAGFSLIGVAESKRCRTFKEGCTVTASIEASAIHVISAEDSQ